MNKWTLIVELNNEWEECVFLTRKEALASFIALTHDYRLRIKRAVLLAADLNLPLLTRAAKESRSELLN